MQKYRLFLGSLLQVNDGKEVGIKWSAKCDLSHVFFTGFPTA